MLNKTKFKLPIIICFLVCQLVLGILVQTTQGKANAAISFACVVLACLFVALFFEHSKSYYLTQTGLACTVMADLFLVVLSPIKQLPAMIFFSVTQLCYFVRLYLMENDAKKRRIHLIVRMSLIVIAIALTIIVLRDKTDALSIVSLFYYANLIVNIAFAFTQFKKCPLFAIGLLLFLLCDTVVGLDVMASDYLPISEGSFIYKLLNTNLNLAWIFYVPSQALIGISLAKFKKVK